MKGFNIIILAAGKGERMMSKKPKVMHEIMGKPMIGYVVERAKDLKPISITAVTGYGRDKVETFLAQYNINYSVQTEQKGTAHAVLTAKRLIDNNDLLILYGDVPLIESSTLEDFIDFYRKFNNITFMTTSVNDPTGYGRVFLEGDNIKYIIEDADAKPEEKKIKEINTGICIIPEKHLSLIEKIGCNNKKGEFYLTDICKVARESNIAVKGYHYDKPLEVLGVNGKKELLEANQTMKNKIIDFHIRKGVTFIDRNVYIETDVSIGNDCVIYPNVYIGGNTEIGEDVFIGPNTIIKDSIIKNKVNIGGFCYIDGVKLKEETIIAPFSNLSNQICPRST